MAEVQMPKMGDAMEEGTILQWLKKVGDEVKEQEILAEIETEKATIEIPALESGTLTEILVQPGVTVPVGTPIAVIGDRGTATNGTAAAVKETPAAREIPAVREVPAEVRTAPVREAAQPPAGGRVKASPLARKVAAAHGLELSAIRGSGPGGRIIEADVNEALQQGVGRVEAAPAVLAAPASATATGTRKPMSTMRKVIARRLTQSKQTIPHFYLTLDVDMRAATRVRGEYNASVAKERKLSVNDLVLRAVVIALERHPHLGAQLDGETVVTPDTVNLGVAVSLEEGLIVPVVKNAQHLSIAALSEQVRELANRAREGKLKPEEYSGGTFSVSNLGMYEIDQFQAVINPPEAAILAVGTVRDTPIVENGAVIPGKQMQLTISVDHRIVDGQVAAVFLREVKHLLQSPMALFG